MIMASLGQAAFTWDIATDEIVWSDHVAAVFPDIPPEALASGSAFSKLIEPNRAIRTDALAPSSLARSGQGAPYRIEYGVRASTAAPVTWIEESGVWFADSSGRRMSEYGFKICWILKIRDACQTDGRIDKRKYDLLVET